MGISVTTTNNELIFKIKGEIDHHNAVILRNEIDSIVENSSSEMVVLDLLETNFMDSAGLGLILGRYRKAEKLGMRFMLVNAGDRILRLLKMSGLDKTIVVKGDHIHEESV
ncbi:MAG TPA: anti-sigma F factor antagonist [Clostridiales bacterium]|jgi:stage II sporulation protein AA (anti-sigma F factor antagonist)|nr:anti-sigma F factor antagonist [Clostridiales bacterium]HBE13718.1 anti-sigma F factor antagonist [Clostridiales bacterium]